MEEFKFKPLANSDDDVKLPMSTLKSIRDKAIAVGADLNSYLEDKEIANIMDAIAKVAYVVGAAKYYLGEDT